MNTETDKQWQVVLDLIEKYKLNQALLASIIGITTPLFSEKKKGKRYAKFSPEEKAKITKYLLGMGKVLVNSLGKKIVT